MKKLLGILTVALIMLSVVPAVLAVSVGSGLTPTIIPTEFAPLVFMCDQRVVLDDNTEPGRLCNPNTYPNGRVPEWCNWRDTASSYLLNGTYLFERNNNYAFEGEKIVWEVLVVDKNGLEKLQDVFGSAGDRQGAGNPMEVNCILDHVVTGTDTIDPHCNARIDQEVLTHIPDNTAAYYKCILTVETAENMYGEYWLTVEALDQSGLSGTMAENEYWFLNPVIALSIEGEMTFDDVLQGADSYSSTILIGNNADASSGVMMDMFISGTDFYDSTSSGAKCPTSNQLALSNFRFFATSGAYSTANTFTLPLTGGPDAEGYRRIGYGIGFNNPNLFYDNYEIIPSTVKTGPYYAGNLLNPGSEIAITFKLSLPEPCNGNFDTGSIYFWGEAI